MVKRKIFYEINPFGFMDGNADGIGDFKGILRRADYLRTLPIDAIIFNNVLASNKEKHSFTKIDDRLGDINAFMTVMKVLQEPHIIKDKHGNLLETHSAKKVFIELEIGTVNEINWMFEKSIKDYNGGKEPLVHIKPNNDTNIDSMNIDYKYDPSGRLYYLVDPETKEIPLNWKNGDVIANFKEVIKFWKNIGVNGFVIKGFEYLEDETRTKVMSEETRLKMRRFYRAVKNIDESIIIVGRSNLIDLGASIEHTSGKVKIFDYFINDKIAENGFSKKYGKDAIGKFSTKKLVKDINKYATDPSLVLSFGNKSVGRVNSRWAGDVPYKFESAISIMLILLQTKASSLVYYGDELGVFNIGLNYLDDFMDPTLESRKRRFEKKGLKISEFMAAQVLNNKINAQSLMPWTNDKNSGFSPVNETIVPANETYKIVNVADQWNSSGSPLNMFKRIANKSFGISSQTYFAKDNPHYRIKTDLLGAISISSADETGSSIQTVVNLSRRDKTIRNVKVGKVSAQSFDSKVYPIPPTTFRPFESIYIEIGVAMKEATKEMRQIVTKEVDEFRKILATETKDQEEDILNKVKQDIREVTQEIRKLERKDGKINSKLEATKEIIIKNRTNLLSDDSYEKIAKDLSGNDTSELEIKEKTNEIRLIDEKTQEIQIAIEESKSRIEELSAKFRAEKSERLNAIESNVGEKLSPEEVTKLKEEDLALTTDIESGSPELDDIL